MKTLIILISMMFSTPASIYTFNVKDIDGKQLDLTKFRGKKVLIVNTASKCGHTPQYAELEKLANAYKGKLVVIGFPANNFGGQEPGENLSIKEFCQKNYGVTFPLAEKSSVKGDDINPLFKYLTTAENPDFTGEIKWNFDKFLINEKGELIHRFRSAVKPMSQEITQYL